MFAEFNPKAIKGYDLMGDARIGNMKLVVHHLLREFDWTGPVVLQHTAPVSDAFRAEFNDWAIALFGGKKERAMLIDYQRNVMYAHPSTVRIIIEGVRKLDALAGR